MWADVHASGLILTFAAITLFGTYESRHVLLRLLLSVENFHPRKLPAKDSLKEILAEKRIFTADLR